MPDAKTLNLDSPEAIRAAGLQALRQALGPLGAVRFLQLFDKGRGDYTKEKYEIPDPPFAELDAELKAFAAKERPATSGT